MLPESWTARGAMLITFAVAAVLCAGLWLGLPPEPARGMEFADAVAWSNFRSEWVRGWMGEAATLLGIAAAAWGVYGSRNLPTANRAATSAEQKRGIVPANVSGEV